jgi:hypothetical protein
MAEGKKQRKFGRNGRAPSNGMQKARSAANKDRAIKRNSAFKSACAEKRQAGIPVPRGTARRLRREHCKHFDVDVIKKTSVQVHFHTGRTEGTVRVFAKDCEAALKMAA